MYASEHSYCEEPSLLHHGLKDHAAFTTSFFHSEVVVPQYHILRWGNNWFTVFGFDAQQPTSDAEFLLELLKAVRGWPFGHRQSRYYRLHRQV